MNAQPNILCNLLKNINKNKSEKTNTGLKILLLSLITFKTEEINMRGIGLGLHICRELVRKLGGDITCKSEWQKGSTFTFVVKVELAGESNEL